jgi:hypothetical protein
MKKKAGRGEVVVKVDLSSRLYISDQVQDCLATKDKT